MRIIGVAALLAACGSHSGGTGDGGGGSGSDSGGGNGDALPPPLTAMYATDGAYLYSVDVTGGKAHMIGGISDGGTAVAIDALAIAGNVLIAIPHTHDKILQLDATNAHVTHSVALSPVKAYLGMTTAPAGALEAGEVVLAATDASDGGNLYRIDPGAGTATAIGPLGSNMSLLGDLAWLEGRGLFGSTMGGMCASICLVTIDPAHGTATPVYRQEAPIDGMSGYKGMLYGLAASSTGAVYKVDPMTGSETLAFGAAGVVWVDAAP